MEFPKQIINTEIIEPTSNHSNQTIFNVYYFIIVLIILIGYMIYRWMIYENKINTTHFLDEIERKMKEWKDYIIFHTNKLLLQLNMEGNAIKTIRAPLHSTKTSLFQ
jgi:hypothetical protein